MKPDLTKAKKAVEKAHEYYKTPGRSFNEEVSVTEINAFAFGYMHREIEELADDRFSEKKIDMSTKTDFVMGGIIEAKKLIELLLSAYKSHRGAHDAIVLDAERFLKTNHISIPA